LKELVMLQSEALAACDNVKGWLSQPEQVLLYDLARAVPTGGVIVELGSWMGRSTIMLAAGSLAGPRAKVFAVDLFANIGVTSAEYAPHLGDDDPDYFAQFQTNIRKAGVDSIVSPIRGTTVDGSKEWARSSIDLLFIDADHSFEGIKADFLAWAPHCSCGSRIAFHDYFNINADGVRRFVNQLLAGGIIDEVGFADSILHARLRVNDINAIKSRLRFRVMGLPKRLLRPHAERSIRGSRAIFLGWAAFNSGNRSTALRNGIHSIWWTPSSFESWRLLACSVIKPVGPRR